MRDSQQIKTWLAYGAALVGGLFCLVPFLASLSVIRDGLRTGSDSIPYFAYNYVLWGTTWLLVASVGIALTVYAFFRAKSKRMPALLAAIVGLTAAFLLPELNPQVSMLTKTASLMRDARQRLTEWDEKHSRFPCDEAELQDALGSQLLAERPIFLRAKQAVQYRLKLVPNATGPYEAPPLVDPGILVYAVRTDSKEYWLTVTTLAEPAGGQVVFQRVPGAKTRLSVVTNTHRNKSIR